MLNAGSPVDGDGIPKQNNYLKKDGNSSGGCVRSPTSEFSLKFPGINATLFDYLAFRLQNGK